MIRSRSVILIFVASIYSTVALTELALQGFLPMTGEGWVGGGACLPATLMALRHVNEMPGLLEGYNLTYSWVDTQCNAGVAAFEMFKALSTPPTKMMLLGGACSIASEATAQVSHLYNLTQIAWGSASPVLSDRKRFPNFYRVIAPDQKLNPAKIALLEEFNWKKVATINQALEFFSMVIDDFVETVNGTDITIISQEIFQHDPVRRVENLKRKDARIIVAACYEDKARQILCAAYKTGLYGPKIVWIFPSWFGVRFWREKLVGVSCTIEEMDAVAEGAFVMGFYFRNPIEERGVAGITVSEFFAMYYKEDTYDSAYSMYEFGVTSCYDHVWLAALALNCTDMYLRESGHPKSVDEFTYADSDINDVIIACMSNISIIGLSGSLSFGEGADPIKNVKMERIQGGQRVSVGEYIMDECPQRFIWNGLEWKDGIVPRDSTYVRQEEISIPLWLYAVMSCLAGFGIVQAIGFFAFNIVNRDNGVVKLSSPNINNVLLLGCTLTYSTVFMETTGGGFTVLCKTRTFCFCLGFTISFGALFSKTWRVYKIFTNKKLLKRVTRTIMKAWMSSNFGGISPHTSELAALERLKETTCNLVSSLAPSFFIWIFFILTGNDDNYESLAEFEYQRNSATGCGTIKDYQLIGMVFILSGMIAFILILWDVLAPQTQAIKELTKEVYLIDNDAEVRPFIRVCYSMYAIHFSWAIYIVEGVLLTFGAFLAWETRHVKIEALNDSRQIGMCLYNVIVLSAVGLSFSLLLEDDIVLVYGITSSCVILGTTVTQAIVFVPKVLSVYKHNPVNVQTSNNSVSLSKSFPPVISLRSIPSGGKQCTPTTNTENTTNVTNA